MNELLRAVAANGDTLGIGALLVTVLGIVLRQLATGRLVFRAEVDRQLAAKDAELVRNSEFADKLVGLANARADKYEAAYTNEASAREAQGDILRQQGETLKQQLELAKTADYMLRQLPSSKAAMPASAGEETA